MSGETISQTKARRERRPWKPADATAYVNEMSRSKEFDLLLTDHAEAQMRRRDLIIGDALHVLKRGRVYNSPEPATGFGNMRSNRKRRTRTRDTFGSLRFPTAWSAHAR
jgi:hypothetical protein